MMKIQWQFCTAFAFFLLLSVHSFAFAAEPLKVTVFGDSLVAGYGLGAGEGFPEQLQKRLLADGYAVEVTNAGVSGDTTSGGLSRLDWSISDDTKIVILELGANDALRGISPDVTRSNLEALILRLKERGIAVILCGMLAPPNMGSDYGKAFNAIYPELAEKHEVALYPFFLEGVAAIPELNLEDRIHPNAKGVLVMVENFLAFSKMLITAETSN